MKNKEESYWEEQARLDDQSNEVLEDQLLDKRFHQEMEWAIKEALYGYFEED